MRPSWQGLDLSRARSSATWGQGKCHGVTCILKGSSHRVENIQQGPGGKQGGWSEAVERLAKSNRRLQPGW